MAEEPPTTTPQNTMCIDPRGNLTLVVGPENVKMLVDANALRRVSKTFGAMLFGSLSEAKQTADWTVGLPEDDPEALEVILNAAHGNIGKLPLQLELDSLFQLAVTSDKYLMVDSLRGPLASRWTCLSHPGSLSKLHMGRTSYQDLQTLSVVTYFGGEEQLKHILVSLIYKGETDSEGRLIFTTMSSGNEDDDSKNGLEGDSEQQMREWEKFVPLSQFIINFVRINRQRVITDLIEHLRNVYLSYLSDTPDGLKTCGYRSMALGIMFRSLLQDSSWPAAGANFNRMSIANLDRVTEELRTTIVRQVFKNCKCGRTRKNLKSGAYPIELPTILGDTWREHLENNLEGFDVMMDRLSTELGARCMNGYLRIRPNAEISLQ